MKRISLVLVLALALTLVFVGSAYANFGPHGGYIEDTDSCAGCHRAHSSFSELKFEPSGGVPVGWDPDNNPSSLLVSNAATMSEFCNACHGDNAPGASTNVVMGVFDGGPSAQTSVTVPGLNDGVVTAYQTESVFGAPLNGGGFTQAASLVDWETSPTAAFGAATSTHSMEQTGILWGAGAASTETMDLTCTNCHDPHGSSNYRLLKDQIRGIAVGGYTAGGIPSGMVYSMETGYDTVWNDNGWLKHEPGQDQMAQYQPNYTSGSADIRAFSTRGSLSTWCAACHEDYDEQSSAYDYGTYEGGGGIGSQTRHRHPVDITLVGGDGTIVIPAQADGVLDRKIPLEIWPGAADTRQNTVGCLTCHFAHGSNATMEGWAAAHYEQNGSTWIPVRDATPGVEPDKEDINGVSGAAGTSALLRADNRGVCERCHDK